MTEGEEFCFFHFYCCVIEQADRKVHTVQLFSITNNYKMKPCVLTTEIPQGKLAGIQKSPLSLSSHSRACAPEAAALPTFVTVTGFSLEFCHVSHRIPKQPRLVSPVFELYVNELYRMCSFIISCLFYLTSCLWDSFMFWGVATIHSSSLLYSIVLNLYSRCTAVCPLSSLLTDGMELFSGFGYYEQCCCEHFRAAAWGHEFLWGDLEWISWFPGVCVFQSVKYRQLSFPGTCPSLDSHQQSTRASRGPPGCGRRGWGLLQIIALGGCSANILQGPLRNIVKDRSFIAEFQWCSKGAQKRA